ncbi:MAG TPA: LpqB family beta-propeller domain-containing protein, partial [Tepidiformaceae bacterium]|nr:LpqB family beta-propeller domain-containing protein [Tepidiformaceae bacterium]
MRVAQALALLIILAVCAACDDGSAVEYTIALDIESGDERRLTDGEQSVYAIELSPDGTRLAAIAGDEDGIGAVVLDAADGTELHRLDLAYNLAIGPFVTWRTDSELLVMRGNEDDVYGTNAVLASWDLTTGDARDIAEFNGGGCCQNRLVVAPDGSAVAVSSARQTYLVTLPDGAVTPLVDDVGFASAVDWTPGSVFLLEAAT